MMNKRRKKLLGGILGLAITLCGGVAFAGTHYAEDIFPQNAYAETTYDFTVSGKDSLNTTYTLYYSKVSETEVSLKKFEKPNASAVDKLEIPATLEDNGVVYKVVAIGEDVFATETAGNKAKAVSNLVIGDNVTIIRAGAFRNNTSLMSIKLPAGLTAIGAGAFKGCSGLTSVQLPASLTTLGTGAFSGCTGLISMQLPSTLTILEDNLFNGCSALKNVTIPQDVTSIGVGVFSGCAALENITIPSKVETIGAEAFMGSGVKAVTIPEKVTVIEANTFKDCQKLTDLDLNNVETIRESAFQGTTALTILSTGNKLKTVGNYAFKESGLVVVRTGTGLTSVGDEAFAAANMAYFDIAFQCPEYSWGNDVFGNNSNVRLLKNEYLYGWGSICGLSENGQWVESLKDAKWSFSGDTILDYDGDKSTIVNKEVKVSDTNGLLYKLYTSGDVNTAVLCDYDENRFTKANKDIVVPETVIYDGTQYTVVEIASSTFVNSTDIYSVVIGANIQKVAANIFDNNNAEKAVKEVYLKSATTKVFNGTTETTYENVWKDKRLIFNFGEKGVNYDTSHIYVNYPLDNYGFDLQGIHYYVNQEDCYAVVGDVSSGDDTSANTSQYSGSDAYSSKEGWAVIPDFVSVGGEYYKVVGVGRYAFYNSKSLVNLELGAFVGWGVDGNEEVRTASGEIVDAKVSDCALRNCQFLQGFTVDDRNAVYKTNGEILFEKGKNASMGRDDTPVKIVKAGKNVTTYNDKSYGYQNVNTVENYAFANCSKLTSFDFAYITDTIGEHAFENTSLTSVILPESTTVCDYAFMNNYALEDVFIDAGNLLGRFVFQNCYSVKKFRSNSSRYIVDKDGVLYQNMVDYAVLLQFPAGNTSIKGQYVVDSCVPAVGGASLPIKEIEAYAFAYSELSDVKISENVLIIGKAAFENSSKLARIEIGKATVMLGAEIADRYNDKSAYISALSDNRLQADANGVYYLTTQNEQGESVRRKVNVYEREVFDGCNILSEIRIHEENNRYLSDNNGILYNKDKTTLLVYAPGITRVSYTVPNSVKKIGLEAFEDNVHLQRLTLPEGIKEVGAKAFNGCTKLSMIYFRCLMAPAIGEQVFNSTGALTKDGLTVYCIPEPTVWLAERGEIWGDNSDLVEKYEAIQEIPDQAQPTAEVYLIYVMDSDGNYLPGMLVEYEHQGAYEGSEPVKKTLTVNEQGYAVLTLPADLSKLYDGNAIGLKITDPKGIYYAYEPNRYILDLATGFSYITLRSVPGVKGVTCQGDDIDTGRVSVNTSGMDVEKDRVEVVVKAHWDTAAQFKKIELCMYIGNTRYVLDSITEDGEAEGSFYTFKVKPDEVANLRNTNDNNYFYQAELTVDYPDNRGTVVMKERLRIDLFNYAYTEENLEGSQVGFLFDRHPIYFNISQNVPLIGGQSFDFELEYGRETVKPITFTYFQDKIVVAVNIDNSKKEWWDAVGDSNRAKKPFYEQLEECVDDMLKEFEASKTPSKSASLKLQVAGVFEIEKSSLYGPSRIVRNSLRGTLKFEFEAGTTITWIVPIRLEFTFTVDARLDLTLEIDHDNQDVSAMTQFNIVMGIEGRAGVGCSIMSIGVYGSGSLDFLITLSEEVKKINLKLSMDIGLYAKLDIGFFKYTAKWSLLDALGVDASLSWEFDLSPKEPESGSWVLRRTDKEMRFRSLSEVVDYSLSQLDTKFAPSDYDNYNEYGGADAKVVEYKYTLNGLPYTKTYKFYIDNVYENGEYITSGYDEYNYLKLVYSELGDNGVWSKPQIVDKDHKYNDTDFDVCADENGIHILYRQVNIPMSESVAEDYVKHLDVYSITYTKDKGFSARTQLSSENYYKGSLEISSIDGVVYAAWTENSEWNVIGTSNEAVFDENKQQMVNALSNKNSLVYASRNKESGWDKAERIMDKQAMIADFEFAKTSMGVTLLVLIDTECDVADMDDRQLYTLNLGVNKPSPAEKNIWLGEEVADAIVELRYENGQLYFRDSQNLYFCTEKSGGWECELAAKGIAFEYQMIYNADGTLFGLGYILNNSDISSDFYIRLYKDGAFGEEIKITSNASNEMVENFTTYATENGRYFIYLESTDNGGNKTFALVEKEIEKVDNLSLVDNISCNIETKKDAESGQEYKEVEVTFSVYNDSLKTLTSLRLKLCATDGTVIREVDLTGLAIAPGATETLSAKVQLESFVSEYLVVVEATDGGYDDTKEDDNKKAVTIAKADLNVTAKYLEIAEVKYLLVMVQNVGDFTVLDYTLYVENGIVSVDEATHEYLYELYCAPDAEATDPANIGLQPQEYKYYTIELNKVYFTEDFVTVSVNTTADEYTKDNNVKSYSMELNEEVVYGKTYMLTYWVDGVEVFKKAYKAGTPIDKSEIAEQSKEGYTFSGWKNEVDVMPMHDQSVYGYYTKNNYTINYYIDNVLVDSDTVAYGDTIKVQKGEGKVGYTFDGWYYSADLTGDKLTSKTMPAEDINVYGTQKVNSYKVTYYLDGGSYAEQVLTYGATITPPTYTAPTGYAFSGWQIPEGITTMPAYNISLYATLEKMYYKVTYLVDENGDGTYVEVHAENVEYEANAPYYAYKAPDGYTFDGWYDEEGKKLQQSDAIKVLGERVLKGVNTAKKYKVSYFINGEEVYNQTVTYGQAIPAYEYVADGYRFVAWTDEVPETMPAKDIIIKGTAERVTYTATYHVDGEQWGKNEYVMGDEVSVTSPSKEGYTFSGWTVKNATGENMTLENGQMPAENITLYGTFTVNTYSLTYYVDGEEKHTATYTYGATVTEWAYAPSTGYTFFGFEGVPETMPAHNVTVYGKTAKATFTLSYYANNMLVFTQEVVYGEKIMPYGYTAPEGYTLEWSGLPETMPAENVTATATFVLNTYQIHYYVDGVFNKTVSYEYGASVEPYAYAVATGYTFLGFEGEPKTMPAKDLTIYGKTAKRTYRLNYYLDKVLIYTDYYEYEAIITAREVGTRYGYSFSGWKITSSETTTDLFRKMPATDVDVYGSMTKNKHKVYYYIGEELRYTDTYEFGATITKRKDEPQTGFTFTGWVGEPTIMQDEDVTVTGGYKVNSYEVSYYVDGNFYKTATVAYGAEVDLSGFETDDYKVVGWTLDEELLETLGMPAGNIQLHAKLEEKKVPLTETVGFAVGASIGGTATGFGLGQLIYYFLKKRRMRNMLE